MTYFDKDGCGGYEYRGDAMAGTDPPDYPHQWTPEQRATAYWFHHKQHSPPLKTTDQWEHLLKQAENEKQRHQEKTALITNAVRVATTEELF